MVAIRTILTATIVTLSIVSTYAGTTQTPEELIARIKSKATYKNRPMTEYDIYFYYMNSQTPGNRVDILIRSNDSLNQLTIVPALVKSVETDKITLDYTDSSNNDIIEVVIQKSKPEPGVRLLMPVKNPINQSKYNKFECKDLTSKLTWFGEITKTYYGGQQLISNLIESQYIVQMQTSNNNKEFNTLVDGNTCRALSIDRAGLDDLTRYKKGQLIKYIAGYQYKTDWLTGLGRYYAREYGIAEIVGPAQSNYSLIIKPSQFFSDTTMIPLSDVVENPYSGWDLLY